MTEPGLSYISSRSDALTGTLRVPGDKSISHRSVILSALANGVSEITGLLEGEDVQATLEAFRQMGVEIRGPECGRVIVKGAGLHGLTKPAKSLDMGNSGTAMRLLCGLLSAQDFASRLVGDESLSERPMRRVALPLGEMGATVNTQEDGTPPVDIVAHGGLKGIDYEMPVASAQVKSALLLAGLYAEGRTCVREPKMTRDHTERMLRAFGYKCQKTGNAICLEGGGQLSAVNIDVPADISSAAFFLVAASIIPGSHLVLEHVGVNPTRTGILEILKSMGADITLLNPREVGNEPVADIEVRHSALRGVNIDPSLVPAAIDEFPIICIAAVCATGETLVSGAGELRHKESDRISAICEGLANLGAEIEERSDGLLIRRSRLSGGLVNSHGDHRIAMSFAVAGSVAAESVTINDCAGVATSFPGFVEMACSAGLSVLEVQT